MQKEIQSYKDQLILRDQKDWIDKRLSEYGVASPFARKQIISECTSKETGLTWKDGKYMGFDDYMKSAKEQDSGLYQSEEEKAAAEKEAAQKEKAPTFTGALGNRTNESEKFVPPKIF